MRKTIFLVLLVLALLAGMDDFPSRPSSLLLLAAVASLGFEVFSLRRRVSALEQRQQPAAEVRQTVPQPATMLEFDRDATEPQEGAASEQRPPSPPSSIAAETGGRVGNLVAPLLRWLSSGNPVLKAGLVIVFFGVAFLLKYAAQRNLIPIELRLAGVAAGGLAMLTSGWLLRHRHRVYGLGLEGGSIGILYLVVFAAAKVYALLPLPLALAIMIGLVGLSCALAVLQDARGLAVFGSMGGFLAPVLLSTGSGSHVALFSYYTLLNAGILGIAWFKAWRELNLVGFVFTFAIAAFWGAWAYTPTHFATTEPFLIVFFLMYATISVLFALRQPPNLRGFIDGPLVFGLPIVTAGLQAALVRDFRYGLALSALAMGGFYIGMARLLWNWMGEGMRLLTEAFLALGLVFASLAIPLGLAPQWSTAAWALEGAAMVWVGTRQHRLLARIFGLLLQVGAAVLFLDGGYGSTPTTVFANSRFLGCTLIAAAALFSAFQLDRNHQDLRPWECNLPLPLVCWGLLWWYGGGVLDLDRHLADRHLPDAILLFACATVLAAGLLLRRLDWPRLAWALLTLLPVMMVCLPALVLLRDAPHPLALWGWLAWPLAFGLQYGLMARFEEELPERLTPVWHALTFWLLLLVVAVEAAWRVDRIAGLADAWPMAAWALAPAALLYALEFQGHRLTWPVERFPRTYRGLAVEPPLLVLALWCLASFALSADPRPLPYLPVINPLELAELAALLLLAIRTVRARADGALRSTRTLLTGALLFAWLNVVVARSVHTFAAIPYRFAALFDSPVFQAAIAALWASLALAMTVFGARREGRRLWLAGAVLLAMVVIKLFVIDLTNTGAIGRIISFLVVGLLMLLIGFFAPLPPKTKEPAP